MFRNVTTAEKRPPARPKRSTNNQSRPLGTIPPSRQIVAGAADWGDGVDEGLAVGLAEAVTEALAVALGEAGAKPIWGVGGDPVGVGEADGVGEGDGATAVTGPQIPTV